jgi:hypothetical protein
MYITLEQIRREKKKTENNSTGIRDKKRRSIQKEKKKTEREEKDIKVQKDRKRRKRQEGRHG